MSANKFVPILVLLVAPSVIASEGGVGSRGGGNVIVCVDSPALARSLQQSGKPIPTDVLQHRVTSIETLDLLAARTVSGGLNGHDRAPELALPKAGESNSQYLERVAHRLDGISPLAAKMRRVAAQMEKATYFPSDPRIAGLAQVYDIGELAFQIDRDRCVLTTAALQTVTPQGVRWDVDARIYRHPRFSRASQGVLMLHELLYRIDRERNDVEESERTRRLVSVLIRQETLTVSEFRAHVALEILHDNEPDSPVQHFPSGLAMRVRTAGPHGMTFTAPGFDEYESIHERARAAERKVPAWQKEMRDLEVKTASLDRAKIERTFAKAKQCMATVGFPHGIDFRVSEYDKKRLRQVRRGIEKCVRSGLVRAGEITEGRVEDPRAEDPYVTLFPSYSRHFGYASQALQEWHLFQQLDSYREQIPGAIAEAKMTRAAAQEAWAGFQSELDWFVRDVYGVWWLPQGTLDRVLAKVKAWEQGIDLPTRANVQRLSDELDEEFGSDPQLPRI